MTQTFVPFLQAAKTGAVTHPHERTGFTNYPPTSSTPSPEAPSPAQHLPRCELKKEGDRIVEIRIFCNCGEVVQLKCDY